MITNFRSFNKEQINKISQEKIDNLEYSIPCKVESINDDLTVNLSSLVGSAIFENISIFYPVGMTFNPNRLKYGFFVSSSYWFGSMLTDNQIQKVAKSNECRFGFFIPMISKEFIDFVNDNKLKDADVCIYNNDATNKISLEQDNIIVNNKDKAFITMEDGIVTIKNNKDNETIVMNSKIELTSKQDVVKLQDGVTINSSTPMNISTQISSLKEIVDGLVECITLASLSTSTAPGSVVTPNPDLVTKITDLQTKINGVLK